MVRRNRPLFPFRALRRDHKGREREGGPLSPFPSVLTATSHYYGGKADGRIISNSVHASRIKSRRKGRVMNGSRYRIWLTLSLSTYVDHLYSYSTVLYSQFSIWDAVSMVRTHMKKVPLLFDYTMASKMLFVLCEWFVVYLFVYWAMLCFFYSLERNRSLYLLLFLLLGDVKRGWRESNLFRFLLFLLFYKISYSITLCSTVYSRYYSYAIYPTYFPSSINFNWAGEREEWAFRISISLLSRVGWEKAFSHWREKHQRNALHFWGTV